MIGIVIALIIVGFASMFAMVHSQSGTVRRIEETQLRQIGADTTERKLIDQRIDNIITIHNANVDHYDNEINQIIARMDQITADIARIDNDEKELRRYYANFREPVQGNGGVDWAPEFPSQEDEHEPNDTETGR